MISYKPSLQRYFTACTSKPWLVAHFTPLYFRRNVTVRAQGMSEPAIERSLEFLKAEGNSKLSVTNYITQYDELNQIREFGVGLVKPPNQAMILGEQLHKLLEDQLAERPMLPGIDLANEIEGLSEKASRDLSQIVQFVNKLITLGFNSDWKSGVVREFPMRGIAPGTGCILRGVIDCVYVSKQGIVILETKTSRRGVSSALMRLAYHQASTYHWMLKALLETEKPMPMIRAMFISSELPSSAQKFLDLHAPKIEKAIERLRTVGLAPYVNVQALRPLGHNEYQEDLFELPYDEQVLVQQLRSRADLFTGERQPYSFDLRLLEEDHNVPVVVTDDLLVAASGDELSSEFTESEKEALRL